MRSNIGYSGELTCVESSDQRANLTVVPQQMWQLFSNLNSLTDEELSSLSSKKL